ncbi:MAG: gas vesicle protein GVPa [Acidobacteriaceae bacterium]|nr:gas vesicle protein GVPa [Acidobacteriaceae bacterium]
MDRVPTTAGTTNLVDILDRVLDKGLVIAGDVRISLANVELLTIRIRLLVCSVDKAEQIGMNWWKYDPHLTMPSPLQAPLLPDAREVRGLGSRRNTGVPGKAGVPGRKSGVPGRAGVPGRNAGVPGRKAGVPGRRKR